MPKRENKKHSLWHRIKSAAKALASGLVIIVLSTLGINAFDNRNNLDKSIVGRLLGDGKESVCPTGMTLVDTATIPFCLDIYENSLAPGCPILDPASSKESHQNLDLRSCHSLSVAGRKPWTNISRDQAAYACSKEGKRLPDNREWQAAAMGTPDNIEPSAESCHIENNWSEQPGITGSGAACVSFSGNHDMIGNVWEWVADEVNDANVGERVLPEAGFVSGVSLADGFPTSTSDEVNEEYYSDYLWLKKNGARGVARGGYWDNGQEAGQYAHYVVSATSESGQAIGFRCAKEANLIR